MSLTIEDGSIVAGANSYTTDAEFVAYAADRGFIIPSTESERDILQILAIDYLDGLNYKGYRTEPSNQSLAFPRHGIYANDRWISSDEIPNELKNAQMEAAIAANSQDLLVNESKSNVSREKMDVLEVAYFSGGQWSKVRLGRVSSYLNPFIDRQIGLIRT